MYMEQFGLTCPPFEETASPAFYVPTAAHRAAMTTALTAVREHHGVVVVTGPAGSGKTVLCRQLLQELHPTERALSFSVAPNGLSSLVDHIRSGFQIKDANKNTPSARIKRLMTAIRKSGAHQRYVVLIDQAENLSTDNLLEVDGLRQEARRCDAALTIILVANPSLLDQLRSPQLRTLADAVVYTDPLCELDDEQAANYIAYRLRAAGCRNQNLFRSDAVKRIVRTAGGQPRRLNELCNVALKLAARTSIREITGGLVRAAVQDATHTDTSSDDKCEAHQPPASAPDAGAQLAEDSLAELENTVEQLQQRAEGIISRTHQRVAEIRDAALQHLEDAESAVSVRPDELAAAAQRADHIYAELTEMNERLTQAGADANERITLLVRTLEAAQGVHEKLEGFGEQIASLVSESHQVVAKEQERIQSLFQQLRSEREELTRLIEDARTNHEKAWSQTQAHVDAQLEATRESAQSVRADAAKVLENARAETEAASAQLSETQQAIETQRAQIDQMTQLHQQCAERAAQCATVAETVHRKLEAGNEAVQRLAEQTELAAATKRRTQEKAEQVKKLLAETSEAASKVDQKLIEVRKLHSATGDLREQLKKTEAQTEGLRRTAAQCISDVDARLEKTQSQVIALCDKLDQQKQVTIEHVEEECTQKVSRIERIGDRVLSDVSTKIEQHQATIDNAEQECVQRVNSIEQVGARVLSDMSTQLEQKQQAALGELSDVKTAIGEQKRATIETVRDEARTGVGRIESTGAQVVRDVSAQLAQQSEAASRKLTEAVNDAQRAITQAVDHAVEKLDRHASKVVETATHHVEQLENALRATHADTSAQLRDTADDCVRRVQSAGKQAEETNESTRQQLVEVASQTVTESRDKLSSIYRGALVSIKQTTEKARSAVAEATETLDQSVQAAVKASRNTESVIERCQQARTDASDAVRQLEKETVAAGKCAEKIGQLIQHAESAGSTAHQRAQALTEIQGSCERMHNALTQTMQEAESRRARLNSQSSQAQRVADTLNQRIDSAKETCKTLASRTEAADSSADTLSEATRNAQSVNSDAARQLEALQTEIENGRSLVLTIDENSQQIAINRTALEELFKSTADLQSRLQQLHKALADPKAMIRDARAQAEELNTVCLRVQRVFRSVAQASVDADEHMRSLGKLLSSSSAIRRSLAQWIAEANRCHQRLAAVLEKAPSIGKTHPVTDSVPSNSTLPDIPSGPASADVTQLRRFAGNTPRSSASTSGKSSQRLKLDDIRQLLNDARRKPQGATT